MAITFIGSTEQASTNDVSPLTFTFDIGTRTNGLLAVLLAVVDTVTHSQANPTWAGAAMATAISEVAEVTTNVWFRTAIYYLSNPANGSNTFSVDYDDGGTDTAVAVFICAAWVDGAAQASALDQAVGGNGATDPSVDITPTANNEIVFGIYHSNQGTLLAVGAGETLIQDHDFGTRVAGASYVIQTTAALQTMNWTGTDAPWKMATASFKELASGAQTISPNAIASTETVYQPTVAPGAITVSPNAIAGAAVVYEPTITFGAIVISPELIASNAQVFAPTLTFGAITIALSLVGGTAIVYQPSVQPGTIAIVPNAIASSEVVYEPTVSIGGLTITPNPIDSAAVVYQPTVQPGAITVALSFLASGAVVFQPTLSQPSGQMIQLNFIVSGAVVYQIIIGTFTLSAARAYIVPAENREYVVPAQSRVYVVD